MPFWGAMKEGAGEKNKGPGRRKETMTTSKKEETEQ